MEGEAVKVPFLVCVVPYVMIPVVVPAMFFRTVWGRLVCLVILTAVTFGWYSGLGVEVGIDKAWRRGF